MALLGLMLLAVTFHSKGPAGNFEGMLVLPWGLAEQKYKMYVFGDGFPGAIVETGGFEEDKLEFRGVSRPGVYQVP